MLQTMFLISSLVYVGWEVKKIIVRCSGKVVAAALWEEARMMNSNEGPTMNYIPSRILISVDSKKSTANFADNGQSIATDNTSSL